MSPDDREGLRLAAVLIAMHAMIGKHRPGETPGEWPTYAQIARGAVSYADAVIEALEVKQ